MMRTRQLFLTALLCVLVAGCETVPKAPPAPQAEKAARALVTEHKFREAAQAYLHLAAQAPAPHAQRYRLAAADALLRAQDAQAAKDVLAGTDLSRTPELATQRDLLLARVAILEGHPQRAFELIPEVVEGKTPAPLAVEIYRTRAQAYERWGNFVAAARERVALEMWLQDPAAVRANREALWESLNRMTPAALAQARTPPPDTLGGWVQLAYIAKQYLTDPGALKQALDTWRADFPGHPASVDIVPDLRELSLEQAAPPKHVALLLPFEGQFAKAADAVRDGFLAAWFADEDNPERPVVSIRDANAANVQTVYEHVVEAGADFVVGPLDKAAVSALVRSTPVTAPTLALNRIAPPAPGPGEEAAPGETTAPEPTPAGTTGEGDAGGANPDADASSHELPDALYQFALSPEGEAERVAERAWFDGHERAAVIAPEGPWGERVVDAFTAAWERLGGMVVGTERYPNDVPKMSAAVERLLHVNESRHRWLALRRLLGRDIQYQPRVRKDIDFIFMAAFPRQARQLRPQLKFHQAGDIPVYATSHVYSGTEDASADRDIDGVMFGDMPWVLLPDGAAEGLRHSIQAAWSDSFTTYIRLYAFGVDAYRIIPQLGKLRAHRYASFPGETGRLSLDSTNRIHRQLMWAQFRDGVPRVATKEMAQQ